jgi:hypothetical protein
MNLQLPFSITPFTNKISYSQKLFFIGSCFAENIGETMDKYKFNTLINPNGVLYNPASIAVTIRRVVDNKLLEEKELFFANECWNSWEHHSRFSNPIKSTCLNEINHRISLAHDFIKQAEWLFITVGSAYYYTQSGSNTLVGNCHKIPQKEFTKHLLTANEIVDDYNQLFQQLKQVNPKLKIIFTVSPVRYIRDGIVENNISKARLIEAVHELCMHNTNTFYFPAYELMIDVLRDYRFYKSDMVHPNEQAIEYIFEKLMEATFDSKTKLLFEKIKDITNASEHKPFHTNTDAFEKFKNVYFKRSSQLQEQHAFLNLKKELDFFS